MLPPRTLLGAGLVLALGLPPLAAIVDRNGDGLSDVWAALYHPTKGATVDEDGDGLTNEQEALAGTDPLNAASRFAAALPQTDPAGNLVLRWRGVWGKRYTVQSSSDLRTWATLAGTHLGAGAELREVVRDAGSAAAEVRRYWRVVGADTDTDGDGMTNAEEIELGSDPTSAAGEDGVTGIPRVYGAEYFVSPTGNDANSGAKAAPFLTLEKATAVVRTRIAAGVPAGGIAVWLRGGVYERTAKLVLGAADSGASAANSVDWRGYPGEEVRLIGGKRLSAGGFTPVTSTSPVWGRLDVAARGRVLQFDVKPALGITAASTPAQKAVAYGTLQPRGFGSGTGAALELFIDQQPMWLARWPDSDLTTPSQDILGNTFRIFGHATPDVGGTFTKDGISDGVSSFKRDGLVNGLQYRLYRQKEQGGRYTAWVLRSVTAGSVYWTCYQQVPGLFKPDLNHPGVGQLSAVDPERVNHGYVSTADPSGGTQFSYVGDRPSRWTAAPDAWVAGFWYWNWADFHLPITSIDSASRVISLPSEPRWGIVPYRPWYAYNLLEEITQPGEWYLDRTSGILYLWPPTGFTAGSEVVVSVMETPLLSLASARHLTLRDLVLEGTRAGLVEAWAGTGITLRRLTLRNSGGGALSVNGQGNLISRCNVTGSGHTPIWFDGGDRVTLTCGDNRMEDCEVHHYARFVRSNVFGVNLGGCGNVIRNNRFHDAPNGAIVFGGNEHLIELNEIYDVCQGSSDAGGIYCGGAWESLGNKLRHNFIHDLHSIFGTDVQGIYIDETGAGFRCEGNVFAAIDGSAFQVGGGRDNVLLHNLAVRCGSGLLADARGLTQMTTPDGIKLLQGRQKALTTMKYREEPWASRYPDCAAIPPDWATLVAQSDRWLTPRGSVFSGNLGWQNAVWISGSTVVQNYFQAAADNVVDQDPLFVDETNLLLGLKPGSPVSAIPGWVPIPFGRIGVRE